MQLGLRQARYFGRAKTLCQLLLAATVANLTLVARKVGLMGRRSAPPLHLVSILIGLIAGLIATITDPPRPYSRRTPAFRPGFLRSIIFQVPRNQRRGASTTFASDRSNTLLGLRS